MLSTMRPHPGIRYATALLGIPISLWSALPTVRWCSPGWSEVRVECLLPCAAGVVDADAACGSAESCEAASECPASCAGTGSAAAVPATESSCADDARFPCGLAFCVDGPTGGDGLPAEGLASAPPTASAPAILPAPPAPPASGERWVGAPAGFERSRPDPARDRFHQARAPPVTA